MVIIPINSFQRIQVEKMGHQEVCIQIHTDGEEPYHLDIGGIALETFTAALENYESI